MVPQNRCLFHRLADGIDMFGVFLDQLVFHREIMLGIDGAFLGQQITDMAIGCQHLKIAAQIFLDRLGLGRRLNYDEIHMVYLSRYSSGYWPWVRKRPDPPFGWRICPAVVD